MVGSPQSYPRRQIEYGGVVNTCLRVVLKLWSAAIQGVRHCVGDREQELRLLIVGGSDLVQEVIDTVWRHIEDYLCNLVGCEAVLVAEQQCAFDRVVVAVTRGCSLCCPLT